MGYAPWIFLDGAGNAWALGVEPTGQLMLTDVTPVPPNAMAQVPLLDTVNGQVYGLTVILTGSGPMLETTGPLSIPAIGSFIPLTAAGITQPFWVQTANGQLIGSFQGPGIPASGPTTVACFAPWIFLDNAGNAWAMGVSTVGQLTLSQVSPIPTNAMQQVPLRDTVTGKVYGVMVVYTSSGPFITTTGPLSIHSVGLFIPLSVANRPFWLQVANGQLIGSWQAAGGAADPVVGQLFDYSNVNPAVNPPNLPNAGLPSGFPGGYLPEYTQPGGIGTQSFPAQQNGYPYSQEPSDAGLTSQETGIPFEVGMGMNVAGCGHSFNSFVQLWTTVGCEPFCLVACPLCSFVQEMFPASVAFDQYHEHISS